LNANYVLSGEYRVDGDRVVIDVELAESKSGQIVWTSRHKTRISAILSGRSELLDEIVAHVSSAVISRELQRAQSQPLPTLKSYTLLLAAIALMHRLSPADFEQARRLLETLVERASRQAIPRAWLAKWHVLRVQQGWSADPQDDARLAIQCTRQALDVDPQCTLALTMDGLVHTHFTKRHDDAQARFDAALAQNPNESLGWLLKGTLHAFKGEGELAVRGTQRALRLSPLDPHRWYHDSLAATAYLSAHQFERALKLAERSLKANRIHTSTLRVIAIAQWWLGQRAEARATVRQLLEIEPSLTIARYRERSPSTAYRTGLEWSEALRDSGVPD
jgi:tetratricopeptide (TPR) repeat protein